MGVGEHVVASHPLRHGAIHGHAGLLHEADRGSARSRSASIARLSMLAMATNVPQTKIPASTKTPMIPASTRRQLDGVHSVRPATVA